MTPRFDRGNELRHRRMAGIEVAVRVRDADDRSLERVVGVAHRLGEGLAQEQRELCVAVARKTAAHAARHDAETGCRKVNGMVFVI